VCVCVCVCVGGGVVCVFVCACARARARHYKILTTPAVRRIYKFFFTLIEHVIIIN
jgi:hypothetical protein